MPSSARNLEETHDLDTSSQTLRFVIPSAAAAKMVPGFDAVAPADKSAASDLIGQPFLGAASKVYVVCSTNRNGVLVVDAKSGRALFTTTVDWVDDDCR